MTTGSPRREPLAREAREAPGEAGLERMVAGLAEDAERRWFGKYRGFVTDNQDPLHLGRLQAKVPSVLGPDVSTGWATPCLPYGGAPQVGLLCVPDRDAGVWIEFEEGVLEFPIWVGAFWGRPGGRSEVPTPSGDDGTPQDDPQDPPTAKILRTAAGHTLQLEDARGAEAITLFAGVHHHHIVLDGDGVTVTDGVNGHQIRLGGDGVTVTDGVNGHSIVMAGGGITVTDGVNSANKVTMGSSGIQLGGGTGQAMVLGADLKTGLDALVKALNAHTHTCPPSGGPSTPPLPPPSAFTLSVPLSTRQTLS